MTRVRISVDSETLGEVEVAEDDHLGRFDDGQERAAIARLLKAATGKIDRAYGLSQKQAAETPKPALTDSEDER